jgi:putative uncharacterized protein (fragment)
MARLFGAAVSAATGNGAANGYANVAQGGMNAGNAVENNSLHPARAEEYMPKIKRLLASNKPEDKVELSKLLNEMQEESKAYTKALKSPYDRNTRVPSDNDKKGLQVQLQQLAEAQVLYAKAAAQSKKEGNLNAASFYLKLQNEAADDYRMLAGIYNRKETREVQNNPVTFKSSNGRVWNDGRYAANLESIPFIKPKADYTAIHTGSVTNYIPTRDPSNWMIGLPISDDSNNIPTDYGLIKDIATGAVNYGNDMFKNKQLRLPSKAGLKKGITNHFSSISVTRGFILTEPEEIKRFYKEKEKELINQGVYTPNPRLHYPQEIDDIWKNETNLFLPGKAGTVGVCYQFLCVNYVRTLEGKSAVEVGIGGKASVDASYGTTYEIKRVIEEKFKNKK